MSERIDITAELHGTEAVNSGFASMAAASQQMAARMRQVDLWGRPINDNLKETSMNLKEVSRDIAIFGTAAMGVANLGKAFGLLNEEQAKAFQLLGSIMTVGGSVIRVMDALTAATWMNTTAQIANAVAAKARAVAIAIANAVANPLFLPIMLAAAATAAASISAMTSTAHTGLKQSVTGGLVSVLPDELILKPAQLQSITENSFRTSSMQTSNNVTVNVYGGNAEQLMGALRRVGIK